MSRADRKNKSLFNKRVLFNMQRDTFMWAMTQYLLRSTVPCDLEGKSRSSIKESLCNMQRDTFMGLE